MSDSLAERLKRLANEQVAHEKVEEDAKQFQLREHEYIAANASLEFTRLEDQIRNRIEEVNPHLGNLPKYEHNQGSRWIQQGNCVASIHFDKPFTNGPRNQLIVGIGVHPQAIYFDEWQRPQPVRYQFTAIANDALSVIFWSGDLGELTTQHLTEIILENLTVYYLDHKPENV
jgi:hypothetical protein